MEKTEFNHHELVKKLHVTLADFMKEHTDGKVFDMNDVSLCLAAFSGGVLNAMIKMKPDMPESEKEALCNVFLDYCERSAQAILGGEILD